MRLPSADVRFASRIALAWAALLGAPALAQDQLAEALDAFAKVKSASEAERAEALAALADFEGEEVTRVLLEELDRAGNSNYRIQVVEAIGQRTRPGVVAPLADHLVRVRASSALRRACAVAIAGQGNQGVDLLAEVVDDPPGGGTVRGRNLRRVCLYGLSKAGDDRAWRVVAEQALEGSISERLRVLELMTPARNTSSVRRARELCLNDPNLRIASAALRQLAEHGYSRAGRAALDLHDRTGARPRPEVRVSMIHSMATVLSRELFEPLIRQAASDHQLVRQAVAAVAPKVTRHKDFVRWLAEEGMERANPEERKAVLWILEGADPTVLGSAWQSLRRRIRTPAEGRVELILKLHPHLKEDPTWSKDLLDIARSSNPALRTLGLGLLAEIGERAGLQIAHRSLGHREWTVRAAAYEFCAVVRDPRSISLLIRRLDHEKHRLREDLLDSLQALTARRFRDVGRWVEWWREREDGFQLPTIRESKVGNSSGSTFSYYQIPLVSNRVAFLVDVSGSMAEKIGTGQTISRLNEAKRQLGLVLEAMPADYMFNIISYDNRVTPVLEGLGRASPEVVDRAVEIVSRMRARGGTNIFGALEMAFDDPNLDTIYLLTDGQPSAGRIVDPVELADEVARWNSTRRIQIHCVSVGLNSDLLKRLAKDSGGTYVYVR